MILLIDNYDSFTYNLKQYLMELDQAVTVYRNDSISIDEITKLNPSHIIISPGPGRPESAGISIDVVRQFTGKIPILGVCLGHQSIGQAFGGKIILAKKLMHGKVSEISHDKRGIFMDVPEKFMATRYHSLVIDKKTLPDVLEITSESQDGDIMGIRHKYDLTEGIQVHPESILTQYGKKILKNFIDYKYMKKIEAKPTIEGLSIKKGIKLLVEKNNLTEEIAISVMNEIMEGKSTEAQISSFITALRFKGETIAEITAFAKVMREKAIRIRPESTDLIDTCGTGGDGSGSFNISTAAAFIAAGADISVAKHGNRGVSSKAGSADLLEALNIKIDLNPEDVKRCIDEVGIGFLFAPKFHPSMKYAIGPRRQIGIRTVFNILGPLTNPALAPFQMMGVYSQDLVDKLASVLQNLGLRRGVVVSSDDGLDEVSLSAPTLIATISESGIDINKFTPKDVGYNFTDKKYIEGGDADENATIIKEILKGKKGPQRDIVCLNSAFAISACKDLPVSQCIKIAEESIDTGNALKKMEDFAEFTNSI